MTDRPIYAGEPGSSPRVCRCRHLQSAHPGFIIRTIEIPYRKCFSFGCACPGFEPITAESAGGSADAALGRVP